jgi:hypothetical protein
MPIPRPSWAVCLSNDVVVLLPTDLVELIVLVAQKFALEVSQIAASAVSEIKGEAGFGEVSAGS